MIMPEIEVAYPVSHDDLMRKLDRVHADVRTLLSYQAGTIQHLTALGVHMSDLDR